MIFLFSNSSFSINGTELIENNSDNISLPESFTWQDVDGIDYTTEVKDQSPAPTCEAYALCAALETKMEYKKQDDYNPDLSETHLYFYAGGTYAAGYVNLIDAANYLVDVGVPDEGCYPDPHKAYDYPFISLDGWENRTVKINDWGWVENNVESIKQALIDYGPLVFCAHFWKDFFTYSGGVYRHRWGALAGGHVMTIIGYDDNEECFIVKNSWGKSWGENGYYKMAYDAGMITGTWYKRYDENCTGIMYLDGAYGNLEPDVPKVYFDNLEIKKTYIFGIKIPTIFSDIRFLTKSTPRIFGKKEVIVNAENTDSVEFYLDGIKAHVDTVSPYSWEINAIKGRHTLKVVAVKDQNRSMDIRDFYKIM